jgi:hypothetical protein
VSKVDGEKERRPSLFAEPLEAHVSESFLRLLDAWRSAQPDQPSRTEAMKQLAVLGRTGGR